MPIGAIAQLGERLVRNEEVSGSIPLSSTKSIYPRFQPVPSRLQDELQQTKAFGSLRQEAILQMARSSAVLAHSWEQYLRGFSITGTQYNVLRILRGAGEVGLSRHAVGCRMVTRVPDVSRLLDRMTAAGLVTRARGTDDRRKVNTAITPKGLSILAELDAPSLRVPDEQLGHMSDDHIRRLIELLEEARAPHACLQS
jgi:DNA-binding MarR family transcriptional regulator